MISSLDILSILSSRENYDRFSPHIKEHLVGKEAWIIIQDMKDWFIKHAEIDWPTFGQYFLMVKHSIFKPEKADLYKEIFKKLDEHSIDEDLADDLVAHFIAKDYATKIAETSLAIVEGSAGYTMDDVDTLLSEYDVELDRSAELETFIVSGDFDEISKKTDRSTGLEWRLPELREALGRITRGDFLVVAAYSGVGKTALLASEVSHMASQIPDGEYILWFNNEERGEKVWQRLIQATLNKSTKEIEHNPLQAKKDYDASGINNKIIFVDKGVMFTNELEQYIKKYPPGLIVIDQLFKVHGFTKFSENEVTRIGMIYNWGREMAKKHAPMLVVHQADGSAAGQLFVEMNQLHMSKVALQGEMDAVITLGKKNEPGYDRIRGLYTPKNKLTGKENFKAEVILDADRARFKSS